MAEKIFGPLKKLPSQIQNLHLFRKAQDVIHKQTKGALCTTQQSHAYGFMEHTTCMAFDSQLGYLAVGTRNGGIHMFGRPGVVSHVGDLDEEIYHLAIIPHQGKLLSFSGKIHANKISLWSHHDGKWKQEKSHVETDTRINAFALLSKESDSKLQCYDLLIGTENGELKLFSLKDFKFVSDDKENAAVSWMHEFTEKFVKGNSADPDCDKSIISLEVDPANGHRLLIAMKNGVVVVRHLDAAADSSEEERWQILRNAEIGEDPAHLLSAHWSTGLVPSTDAPNYTASVVCGLSTGSYSIISVRKTVTEDRKSMETSVTNNTPYGPFPCSALGHVRTFEDESNGRLVCFSGGVPRSTYADRHTVSIMRLDDQGHVDKGVCYDLFSAVVEVLPLIVADVTPKTEEEPKPTDGAETSAVVDQETPAAAEKRHLEAVLILCEEELVAIDMRSEDWLEMRLPYLSSMNFSPVTALSWLDHMDEHIVKAFASKTADHFSTREWPITGGALADTPTGEDASSKQPVLIGGHLDGTISFWSMQPGAGISSIGSFSTLKMYNSDTLAPLSAGQSNSEENLWPPFRRVGLNRDHPLARAFPVEEYRVAISLIEVVPTKDSKDLELLLATLGGQCSIWKWHTDETTVKLQPLSANLLEGELADKYRWQDREAIQVHSDDSLTFVGETFHPTCIVAMNPPAPVLCMHLHSQRHILAVGTAHGFAIFDVDTPSLVYTKCTLPDNSEELTKQPTQGPSQYAALRTAMVGRGKQIRDNLRQSMRRFKNIRLPRSASYSPAAAGEGAPKTIEEETVKPDEEETVEKAPETVETENIAETKTEEATATVVEAAPATETTEETKVEETPAPEAAPPAVETEPLVAQSSETAEVGTSDATPVEVTEPAPKEPFQLTGADLSNFSVRCVHLAVTYVFASATPSSAVLVLFVGTQHSSVLMYSVEHDTSKTAVETVSTEPVATPAEGTSETPAATESSELWSVKLVKELQLRHGAPVIGVAVLSAKTHRLVCDEDASQEVLLAISEPVQEAPVEVAPPAAEAENKETPAEGAKPAEAPVTSPAKPVEGKASERSPAITAATLHELVVCTEEQVKVFSLPQLRAKHKHKVTNLFPGRSASQDLGAAGDSSSLSSNPLPRSPTGTLLASSSTAAGGSCTLSTPAQMAGRRIRGFSLQWDSMKGQRVLLLLLNNGQFQVLNLHAGLRKWLTGQYCSRQCSMSLATAVCVYSHEYRLLLSQPCLGEVVCTEYSFEGEQGYTRALSAQRFSLNLPELKPEEPSTAPTASAPSKTEEKPEEVAAPAEANAEVAVVNVDGDATIGTIEQQECKENGDHEAAETGNTVEQGEKLGDMTVDSVKEYITDKSDILVEKKLASDEHDSVNVNVVPAV